MASIESKLLQAWIAPPLKAAGFTKLGATWHRSEPPFIHVVNIQGSRWSPSFDFNLGIYITSIGELDRPKEYQCHFRERLDRIVPNRERFFQLCDFELDISEQQRRTEIECAITSYAVPWISQFTSKEQFRQYILREQDRGLAVSGDALKYLGIPIDNS